jgi:hypothetical protein
MTGNFRAHLEPLVSVTNGFFCYCRDSVGSLLPGRRVGPGDCSHQTLVRLVLLHPCQVRCPVHRTAHWAQVPWGIAGEGTSHSRLNIFRKAEPCDGRMVFSTRLSGELGGWSTRFTSSHSDASIVTVDRAQGSLVRGAISRLFAKVQVALAGVEPGHQPDPVAHQTTGSPPNFWCRIVPLVQGFPRDFSQRI